MPTRSQWPFFHIIVILCHFSHCLASWVTLDGTFLCLPQGGMKMWSATQKVWACGLLLPMLAIECGDDSWQSHVVTTCSDWFKAFLSPLCQLFKHVLHDYIQHLSTSFNKCFFPNLWSLAVHTVLHAELVLYYLFPSRLAWSRKRRSSSQPWRGLGHLAEAGINWQQLNVGFDLISAKSCCVRINTFLTMCD